jgi:hypothetical protein
MNKYEKLIEHIINDDEAAAKELFHQLVVEKSRDIYESLMDEEIGGNQAQGFVQDITNQDDAAQDMGLGEDDEEAGEIELGGDDMGDEDGFGDEETFGDEGGEGDEHSEILGKMDELESQLADLKAMLGGEEHGMEDMGDDDEEGDMDDMGGENGASDFDHDDMEESQEDFQEAKGSGMMEAENPFAKSGKSGSGKSGSGKSGSGMSGSGKSGSGKMESYKKTDVEIMKEYVDKIGEIYKGDQTSPTGKMAGASTGEMGGQRGEQNVDSIEGPGADFGGTNENILNGKGNNQNPDGKAYTKPKNVYSKGETTFSNEKFQNAPGSNAGKTAFKTKAPGHGAEQKSGAEGKLVGADGSRPINKKSVQAQNTGKK